MAIWTNIPSLAFARAEASVLTPDDNYPNFSWPVGDPFSIWIAFDSRNDGFYNTPTAPIVTISSISYSGARGSLADSTVAIFTNWLYRNSVESRAVEMRELVRCWVFGRVFKSSRFQNCLRTRLLARVKKGATFSASAVQFMSRFTATGNSKLRTLAVDAMLNLES